MKRNKVKIYTKALAEIILQKKEVQDKIIAVNFLKLLEKEGLRSKVKEIISLAENLFLAKQGKHRIIFETAREITSGQKKILHEIAKKGDVIEEKINPDLIAGVKIIINNERQFDASMLKNLQQIYEP